MQRISACRILQRTFNFPPLLHCKSRAYSSTTRSGRPTKSTPRKSGSKQQQHQRSSASALTEEERTYLREQYAKLTVVYGRKPVFDALQNSELRGKILRLHIDTEVVGKGLVPQILQLAKQQSVPIIKTTSHKIARISGNGSLAQGIVADIDSGTIRDYHDFFLHQEHHTQGYAFIALDGLTTPKNIGTIIRTVAAAGLTGVIMPRKGCPKPSHPEVIRASAGCLFRTSILQCDSLAECLQRYIDDGAVVYLLDADDSEPSEEREHPSKKSSGSLSGTPSESVFDYRLPPNRKVVYVFGNEARGISDAVKTTRLQLRRMSIPMANGVESLNASVSAAVVAFRHMQLATTSTNSNQ